MKKITLIGAGLVGSAMAQDLLEDRELDLTVIDMDNKKLDRIKDSPRLNRISGDIRDTSVRDHVYKCAGVILNAVPGHLGFEVLKSAIEAGKDIVDISFAPEDPLPLSELATEKGVTAIVDMGVAPGMSNVLAGCADREMDKISSLSILVGGLPKERRKPFEYKAGFSPVDVIEEYTRPARFIQNGKIVSREALTDVERVDFSGIGTLEAFNSDGLRTLMHTISAEQMVEKTLRYPGHADLMMAFRETGLFDEKPISLNGNEVVPRDLTSTLLFRHWKLNPHDEDFTVMRVLAEGKKEHRRVIFAASLYDEYDNTTGVHSMARTTGYAATAALRLLLSGKLRKKGVIPPEEIGRNEKYARFMIEDQAERGVHYNINFEREEDWSTGECGSG